MVLRLISGSLLNRCNTRYIAEDIIILLAVAHGKSHSILVNATAKNIKRFTHAQIIQILVENTQDETHELFASALQRNYNYFTSFSIGNVRLLMSENGLHEYSKIAKNIKDSYRSIALQPLARDLSTYHGEKLYNILKTAWHQYYDEILTDAIAQNIGTYIDNYSINDLRQVLNFANRQTSELITRAIAQNIDSKIDVCSADDLYYIMPANPHHAEIIINAIIKKIDLFINRQLLSTQLSQTIGHIKQNPSAAWEFRKLWQVIQNIKLLCNKRSITKN